MRGRNWALVALLAAVVVASLIWDRLPMSDRGSMMEQIPTEGWKMRSREVPLTDLETKWLDGATGMKRVYEIDGALWLLAVTDGTQNRQVVHDPTYCFRGDGWRIDRRTRVPLEQGEAEQLVMSRDGETMKALYWFTDGGAPFASMIEYWGKATWGRLTRGTSGPEPLLFVLRPVGERRGAAEQEAILIAPLLLPGA